MAAYEEFYPWRDSRVVRVVVVGLFILPTGLILGLGTEVSTKPWYTLALAIGLPILLAVLLLSEGMRTTVDAGTLRVRLWPFLDRRIPVDEIRSVAAVQLDPAALRERAVRDTHGRTTFSLHDGEGVELALVDGTTVLVGSSDPAALAAALAPDARSPPASTP